MYSHKSSDIWCITLTFAGIELTFLIIPPFSLDASSTLAPQIVCRPTSSGSSLNSIHRLRLRWAVRYHTGRQHFHTYLISNRFPTPMGFLAIRILPCSLSPNWTICNISPILHISYWLLSLIDLFPFRRSSGITVFIEFFIANKRCYSTYYPAAARWSWQAARKSYSEVEIRIR